MVVLNYTLQLLPAADWPPLLRRVQSALRPGGLLFLTAKVGPYIGDDPEDSAAAAAIDDGLCAPSHFATVPLQRVHLNSALGVPTARWSQHCVLKYTVLGPPRPWIQQSNTSKTCKSMKFARKKRSKKVALILPRNAPKLRYEKACSGHIRMQKYDAVPPLDVSRSRSNPWARPAALTGLRRLAGLVPAAEVDLRAGLAAAGFGRVSLVAKWCNYASFVCHPDLAGAAQPTSDQAAPSAPPATRVPDDRAAMFGLYQAEQAADSRRGWLEKLAARPEAIAVSNVLSTCGWQSDGLNLTWTAALCLMARPVVTSPDSWRALL